MWFRRKDTAEDVALREKQAACKHDGRFTVYGTNSARPPCGACDDCGAELWLDDIMNVYFRKMNAILDKNGMR